MEIFFRMLFENGENSVAVQRPRDTLVVLLREEI